jgi:homoserine/homoserine lactone efflux protein
MLSEYYFLFLQIIFFMFITPGAPRILIMSQSINYGFKKSLWTALGDITANTIQIIIVLVGLNTVIKIFPDLVFYFKWMGISYLLYIAYGYLRSTTQIKLKIKVKTKSIQSLFLDGFLIAFFGPKAIIFFITIFPTFIPSGEYYLINVFIFWITYVTLDFITLATYSSIADKISASLASNPYTLNYISATALLIISIVIGFKV